MDALLVSAGANANADTASIERRSRSGIVATLVRDELGADGPHRNMTAFLVEKEPGPSFEGISVGPNIHKLGYRGVVVALFAVLFTYMAFNVADLVIGRGAFIAIVGLALGIVGLGRGAPDRAPVYVGGRVGDYLSGAYASAAILTCWTEFTEASKRLSAAASSRSRVILSTSARMAAISASLGSRPAKHRWHRYSPAPR